MEETYSIGQLVKELNINKETIRYYEKIGLISQPKKDDSGYRVYSNKDIETIKFILIAKNLGFTLKEISVLLHDEILHNSIEDIKIIVESKIKEIKVKMDELEETKNLLEKVQKTILTTNLEICNGIEIYHEK
ncbi:MerR family transcriptional regulator [Clostridium sp. YIM B02505]|uniref:MerR family transcriptional regulator n=1 Tax=Clostridium yunnanense TaxID=2800325 RepID=A0ABS1ES65_9CLOT|nr:MerR family transcriptional regulator [Clostridium yunnanense]MBK1812250.1 MerR family transcriptional regulator [Clostridium yunnanense]